MSNYPAPPLYRVQLVREAEPEAIRNAPHVRGPEDVAVLLAPLFDNEPRERFVVVALSMAGAVIGASVVSEGGLASSIVEPRAVFQFAILHNAATIIVAHTHPSGNPEPSREDIAVTKQLADAGGILGIPVRDHLIFPANGEPVSFSRRGLL